MWRPEHEATCGRYGDLVAVLESPQGALGLLLRHTVVPLLEERRDWFADTRRVAHEVITSLRATGAGDDFVVLQWQPFEAAAEALHHWTLRYDGDRRRRKALTQVVDRRLADRRFVATRTHARPQRFAGPGGAAAAGHARSTLLAWYCDMMPCWLAARPLVRRRLILQTHRWLLRRVLGALVRGAEPAVEDLAPGGLLRSLLESTVPPAEAGRWRSWIGLVLLDFRRALAWPPAARDEAWRRWLFLIPYSIPLSHGTGGVPGKAETRLMA